VVKEDDHGHTVIQVLISYWWLYMIGFLTVSLFIHWMVVGRTDDLRDPQSTHNTSSASVSDTSVLLFLFANHSLLVASQLMVVLLNEDLLLVLASPGFSRLAERNESRQHRGPCIVHMA